MPFVPPRPVSDVTLVHHVKDKNDPHGTLKRAKQVRMFSSYPSGRDLDVLNDGDLVIVYSTGVQYRASVKDVGGSRIVSLIELPTSAVTKAEIAAKADKATTLAGYGITDAATKAELADKADLVGGKVSAAQLPSYVDDVLEYDTMSAFPAAGEDGKIYVAKDTNLAYRWGGTQYVEISQSLALGETASTAYPGDKGLALSNKIDAHISNINNPHAVTAEQVGALPLVKDDFTGGKTAVTIGTRGSGAVGPLSIASGMEVVASGSQSHAKGAGTTASGQFSRADGNQTVASGQFSRADGDNTVASGQFSHADGHKAQTRPDDAYAFAWNGDSERSAPYFSHGPGTFNINPLGGLDGFYIGEQTLYAILTNKADKADISATNTTFSNAVLAVGLNIDTNSVAVLNDIAETFGGFPIEGTATTVGGLLAALAAAVAWLKKNKADKTTTTNAAPAGEVALTADRVTVVDGSSGVAVSVTIPTVAGSEMRLCELLITGVAADGALAVTHPANCLLADGADATSAGANHFVYAEYQRDRWLVTKTVLTGEVA